MNLYLEKYKYGNAKTEELWESLDISSGARVTEIMPTWTNKMGFPLISVFRILSPNLPVS